MKLFKNEKMQDISYVRKQYYRTQLELLAVFLLLLAVVVGNYDYLMLKLKLTTDYLYTDTLNEMSQKHLKTDFSIKNMDLVTIALYGESLSQEDSYFYLFKQGEYKTELEKMEKTGESTRVYQKNGAAVLEFKLFTKGAIKKTKEEIQTLKNADRLIIDLRNNPGGEVEYAEQLADLFLSDGQVIYSSQTKGGIRTIRATGGAELSPQEIIILQNDFTASASEIFIMALCENLENVTIIGEKSYGKGIGQNEYRLKNGYALKMTALKLLTPSGKSVHNRGITPDIEYTGDDAVDFALKTKN